MPMNPRLLVPRATFVSPLSIDGCIGWYDSADLSAMAQNSNGTGAVTVGDQVGYWKDKSTTAAHVTQATAANRPTLTSNQVNGRAALRFDGSNDTLSRTSYTAQSGLAGLTRIAVFSTSQNAMASTESGGASNAFFIFNAQFISRVSGTAGTATAISPVNQASLRVYASLYDGSGPTMGLYFNNALQSSEASPFITTSLPATTTASPSTLFIGSNGAANNFINGPIAEYVIYNRALSSGERTAVYQYLRKKWGFA